MNTKKNNSQEIKSEKKDSSLISNNIDPSLNDLKDEKKNIDLKFKFDTLQAKYDILLRTLADADNALKRAKKEKDDLKKYAISSFVKDILPVQDNLQRALENDDIKKESTSFDTFTKGIIMTLKEFSSVLSKHGLSEINPVNSPFDSNFHQAIFEEERSDVPVGTIIKVLQKGFLLKGRLIRPAMVISSKAKKDTLE